MNAGFRAISCLVFPLLFAVPGGAFALTTTESERFLLIGGAIDDAVLASNFELGANQSATPQSGLSLGQPFPPANTLPVASGISGDGNVAVLDSSGQFKFSDLDIHADASIGVQCAGSANSCNGQASNTSFNGSAFPANGLSGNVDFTALRQELDTARTVINALTTTGTIDLTLDGGKISNETHRVDLLEGLNVIDIITNTGGETDFQLENSNFVIDGASGSSVIFRVEDDANMLVSQSAIVVGDGGIGLDDVMFFSDKYDNDTHFSLSNVVVNGVAFWDLSDFTDPSEIGFNNVQGCTQAVGNKLNTGQDVRLTRCSFSTTAPIPEPSTAFLLAVGLASLALGRKPRS